VSYFNLELNPTMASGLEHTLNRRYKGATLFAIQAPDAAGTLRVWARDEAEAREHLVNAMFDLVFNRNRVGAAVTNPRCIYCGGRAESRGRNSSGTRCWRCLNPECRHSFVLNREFRGGINHPSQSKKPAFARLLLAGTPVAEAASTLGIHHNTAGHWAAQIAELNKEQFAHLLCKCGRPLRHRGICLFRYSPAGRQRVIEAARNRQERKTA
jgi:transposase-like protein